MDLEKLLKALDNEENENLMNFNSEKLKSLNYKILSELNLSDEETKILYDKLIDYKYVDEMSDLRYGSFIRWINISDPNNLKLSNGGIFFKFKITPNGTNLLCKLRTQLFNISLDKNLIFQKLTNQEKILLTALDHLS